MKPNKTKEMSGRERTVKTKLGNADAVIESSTFKEPGETTLNPIFNEPIKMICLRECEMPGIGLFRHGQIIEDQLLIARIGDNPNFEKIKEEAQS